MRTTSQGPAILPGYTYRLRLASESDLFPEAARYLAEIRETPSSDTVLATLRSEDGGFVRIGNRELELVLSPAQTSLIPLGRVLLDIVRSDLTPPLHLGIFLELPVMQPITRGAVTP